MPVDEETATRLLELTRQLRSGDETARTRRERLLEAADVEAHVREDDDGPVLVLYPAEWIEDGTVDPAEVDDPDIAIEQPLTDDTTTAEADYHDIAAHNETVAEAVERRHGPVHGATAKALATYLSNHHLVRIEDATSAQLETFCEDYLVRNAWPSPEQQCLVGRTIDLTKREASRLIGK